MMAVMRLRLSRRTLAVAIVVVMAEDVLGRRGASLGLICMWFMVPKHRSEMLCMPSKETRSLGPSCPPHLDVKGYQFAGVLDQLQILRSPNPARCCALRS
jgi:hypothetical protein